jgi:hypothetical protein
LDVLLSEIASSNAFIEIRVTLILSKISAAAKNQRMVAAVSVSL